MKISDERELRDIVINHLSNISTKDFINIHKKYTAKPYSFLVDDTTLTLNNPLRFRKNLTYNKNNGN